jgi:hypothetical protein
MMPIRMGRKGTTVEKVENFCRTATMQKIMPAMPTHATVSLPSGGFKFPRENHCSRRRQRIRNDRGRIANRG